MIGMLVIIPPYIFLCFFLSYSLSLSGLNSLRFSVPIYLSIYLLNLDDILPGLLHSPDAILESNQRIFMQKQYLNFFQYFMEEDCKKQTL